MRLMLFSIDNYGDYAEKTLSRSLSVVDNNLRVQRNGYNHSLCSVSDRGWFAEGFVHQFGKELKRKED